MLRLLSVVAVVAILAGPASAGWTVANKFIVKYSIIPDLTHNFNFYEMPRTVRDAEKDHFAAVASNQADNTTTWCRKGDHRVCVIFDAQGSVAGIQIAVIRSELDGAVPMDMKTISEWRSTNLMGLEVYTATAYFVSKETLLAGGRSLSAADLTAPEGIFILQTDVYGYEFTRVHVPNDQSQAGSARLTEQACFFGMGTHYFQGLTKSTSCANYHPYFTLYNPKTSNLHGFGFIQFGKASQGRGWFENPSAAVAKMIAPNSPECQSKWVDQYGRFTMHVYFVDRRYLTRC